MPNVSVSLSEAAYEGYQTIPKQSRSRKISKMLEQYALKSVRMKAHPERDEAFTGEQVLEMYRRQVEITLILQERIKELEAA